MRAVLFWRLYAAGLLLLLLCALGQLVASGQSSKGGISGFVSDKAGAVIPGAAVTATNLSTGLVRTTISGPDGNFLFPLLDPGSYRLDVEAQGFTKVSREPIAVRVTETTGLGQMVLAVGSTSESVTVTDEAPLLQTEAATTGNVFNTELVQDLPLVTRNFTQLLSLQAGVVSDVPNSAAFGKGTQGFSSAGARAYDNSILINGANAVSSITGGTYSVAVPAPDTVEEFKVQSSLYSAEYGQAGGASVNLVTKSGTNKFHGNVYEFFRNNALNANDYFRKAADMAAGKGNHTPILRQNQFGGTVGGPILKNRTFFFFGYEGTRQLNGAAPGFLYNLPLYPYLPDGDRSDTAALRANLGKIYGGQIGGALQGVLPSPVLCGLGIDCVAADGSNISPVAIKLLQQKLPNGEYFLPSFPQTGGSGIYSNANFSLPGRFNGDQYILDLDHQISTNQLVALKLFTENDTQNTIYGNLPGVYQRTTPQNRNFTLSHTLTLTPTLVNEAHISVLRVAYLSNVTYPFTASDVGMKPAPDGGSNFPWLMIREAGISGAGPSPHSMNTENAYSVFDTVSKLLARHSVRFGGSFTYHRLPNDLEQAHAGGTLMLNFADFLIGEDGAHNGTALLVPNGVSNIVDAYVGTGSFRKTYRFNDLSFFAQDDIKLTNRFTLNLGLRWDRFEWPREIDGRMAGFNPALIAEGRFGTPTLAQGYSGFTLSRDYAKHHPNTAIPAGVTLVSNTLMNGTDGTDFGPRIGFAWQPRNQWSIRGGFGLFFSRPSDYVEDLQGNGLPFNSVVQEIGQPYGSLADPFTYVNLPPDSAYPIWTPRQYVPGVTASYYNYALPPDQHNSFTEQWNFGIQHEFAGNFLVEISYLGSEGQRLQNNLSGNQAGIASPEHPIRGQQDNTWANMPDRVPVAGVGPDEGINEQLFNGKSLYNAGFVNVSKRMSHGIQFLSSLTYAKSRDNGSGINSASVGQEPPGDNNYNNHWGLSDWDRKLRSTTSLVYQLPDLLKGRRGLLDKFTGGWQAAAAMTFQSGTPTTFTVDPTYHSAVVLNHPLTPNLAPGVKVSDLQGHGPIRHRLTNYFGGPGLTTGTKQPITDPATGKTSPFLYPGATEFGELGRNLSIRTPGQKTVDFSAVKLIPVHEGMNVEFRTEFFNLFNWVNFAGANTNVDTAAFGFISNTTVSPRVIQAALKVTF